MAPMIDPSRRNGTPPAKIMTRPWLDTWIPKNCWPGWLFCGELRRRDVDTADPRAVHSNMAHQIPADIDHGDVHRLPESHAPCFPRPLSRGAHRPD
jgi:hypothetical protein